MKLGGDEEELAGVTARSRREPRGDTGLAREQGVPQQGEAIGDLGRASLPAWAGSGLRGALLPGGRAESRCVEQLGRGARGLGGEGLAQGVSTVWVLGVSEDGLGGGAGDEVMPRAGPLEGPASWLGQQVR